MKAIAYLFCSAILLICSCHKESVKNEADPRYVQGIYSIRMGQDYQSAEYKIWADSGAQIIGRNSRLVFQPGSFLNKDSTVYSGYVTVQHSEKNHTKASKILNQNSPYSDEGILATTVDVYLTCRTYLVGYPLSIKPNYATIQFMADTFTGLQKLFCTENHLNGRVQQHNSSINSQTACLDYNAVTMGNTAAPLCGMVYSYPLESTGAISMGQLLSDEFPDFTKVTIQIPLEYETRYTTIALAMTNSNTVSYAIYSPISKRFSTAGLYSVPVGASATIIALTYKEGQWYSSFTPVTFSANHSQTINFSPTTLQDYKNAVLAL